MRSCSFCKFDFPESSDRCHHCGRPSLFPNVEAAAQPGERAALQARYDTATTDARKRGAEERLAEFESAAAKSEAVLARPFWEISRLATGDTEIYATYYQMLEAGARVPAGSKWDLLRALGDDTVFPSYRTHIRFAALTLEDQEGLSNYGDCSIFLKDDMIEYRSSVFEENSAIWAQRSEVKADPLHLPPGYRAAWGDRAKLAVAKLGSCIDSGTQPSDFPGIMIQPASTSDDDQFIEVHIWGPLTRRSFRRVVLRTGSDHAEGKIEGQIKYRLEKVGVEVVFK